MIATTTKAIIEMAQTKNEVASKRVRRMFGHDLQWWNTVLVVFLAIGAFSAISVVVATRIVIKLQDQEAVDARRALEEYKVSAKRDSDIAIGKVQADADVKITQANTEIEKAKADAAEANRKAETEKLERVKLEAIVAPRTLRVDQQLAIARQLRQFAGKRVSVTTYSLDAEGATLATQIIALLGAATIDVDNRIASVMPLGGFSLGIHVTGADENLAASIRSALSVTGGLVVAPAINATGAIPSAGIVGNDPGSKPVDAAILVGVKPVITIR